MNKENDSHPDEIMFARPMTDEEIEADAAADLENPPMTEEEFQAARQIVRPQVKVVRRALDLTQEEFAERYMIPLGTLRAWEQGVSVPDKTAQAYLRAICGDAAGVARALRVHEPARA